MLFCSIMFVTGCSKQDSNICNYTQSDINQAAAPGSEVNALTQFMDRDSVKYGYAILDPRGFYYKIEREGSIEKPLPCASVSINYVGTLTDGKIFDSGENVSLNLENLIMGWKMGLPLVGKGGKITLYLPPYFGYGSSELNGIPSNSILIFSIDLINFTNP